MTKYSEVRRKLCLTFASPAAWRMMQGARVSAGTDPKNVVVGSRDLVLGVCITNTGSNQLNEE